jgi:steroid 5-alpha reductase family enzyme
MSEKTRGLLHQAIAYVVAIGVAFGIGSLLPTELHILWRVAIADVAATVVVFAFSRIHDNSSLYDPYWSVAPMVIAGCFAWLGTENGASAVRMALAGGLVGVWGVRLTYNFFVGWSGLDHEDWRYRDFRRDYPRAYWLISFLGIHLFPTVLTLGGSLSLYPAMALQGRPLNWLDGLAALVTAAAIAIEAIADAQLREFARNTDGTHIMEDGLWHYSRHPNYFGEIGFWWGLWIFAMAAAPTYWWTVAGPVAITLLFIFVSLPLIDKRHLKKRPAYREHMRKVSGIVPWFRRDD